MSLLFQPIRRLLQARLSRGDRRPRGAGAGSSAPPPVLDPFAEASALSTHVISRAAAPYRRSLLELRAEALHRAAQHGAETIQHGPHQEALTEAALRVGAVPAQPARVPTRHREW